MSQEEYHGVPGVTTSAPKPPRACLVSFPRTPPHVSPVFSVSPAQLLSSRPPHLCLPRVHIHFREKTLISYGSVVPMTWGKEIRILNHFSRLRSLSDSFSFEMIPILHCPRLLHRRILCVEENAHVMGDC